MTIERYIRIFAGTMILLSLALGVQGSPLFVSAWFLLLTAFVGANLLQFGFTNFCPVQTVLRKLGVAAAAGGGGGGGGGARARQVTAGAKPRVSTPAGYDVPRSPR